jgi:hypothetical protein
VFDIKLSDYIERAGTRDVGAVFNRKKNAQHKIINPQSFDIATFFSIRKAFHNFEYSSFQSGLIRRLNEKIYSKTR